MPSEDLSGLIERLDDDELMALEYACSEKGGWPRELPPYDEDGFRNVITDYRTIEGLGLVREVPEDRRLVGHNWRLHFVGTDKGLAALKARSIQERKGT